VGELNPAQSLTHSLITRSFDSFREHGIPSLCRHIRRRMTVNGFKTSSSPVAKRPRDALCLSVIYTVVSFNSTIRRTVSFIVSYIRYRFIIY